MQTASDTTKSGVTSASKSDDLSADVAALRDQLNAVLLGKREVVDLVVACLLARGHLLLEDRPGLGKTSLAKALAAAVGGRLARVQCTPDLLPGDVTGFNVFNQKTREFDFVHGPVFADVLLCDEINRATPRTQSALLEAMAERQVTVDDVRYALSPEFFVVATQNPAEQHGTFPLPEAQLDRFAIKLGIGYPDRDHERRMLALAVRDGATAEAQPVRPSLPPARLREAQEVVAATHVSTELHDYFVDLAQRTRGDLRFAPGISPRGLLVWQRMAQAWAFLQGRDFVTPDDIQHTALPVLSVRLAGSHDVGSLVAELIEAVPTPAVALENGRRRGASVLRSLLGLAAVALLGCAPTGEEGSGGSQAAGRTQAAQSTYDEHDHDTPPHKPDGFPNGVADLVRRHAELAQSLESQTFSAAEPRYRELLDIVRWLPALAADGDLPETQWRRVKQAVDRLQAAYGELAGADQGPASKSSAAALTQAQREFAELQLLAVQHADAFEITPRSNPLDEGLAHGHAPACKCGHDHRHDHSLAHDYKMRPPDMSTAPDRPTIVFPN